MMSKKVFSLFIKGLRLAALAGIVLILNFLAQSEISRQSLHDDHRHRRSPRLAMIEADHGASSGLPYLDSPSNDPMRPSHTSKAGGLYEGMRQSGIPPPAASLQTMQCPQDTADMAAIALWSHLDCRKRHPSVVFIGVDGCGTDVLSTLLSQHPAIKHAMPFDMSFWSQNVHRGVGWYINQMPVSSMYHVTMEKTSSYIFDKSVPERLSLIRPELKIILMVCDPVMRAMSEFLQLSNQMRNLTDLFPEDSLHPFLAESFADAVLDQDGLVNANSSIVARGRYATYLMEWLEYFPLEQFLIIDGMAFKENPLVKLKRVENFLGVFPYFDASILANDASAKTLACKTKPAPPECSPTFETLERFRPFIAPDVQSKLRRYYRPYNARFASLTGKIFPWIFRYGTI